MNKFIIIYICSLVLATGSFAQTPTVPHRQHACNNGYYFSDFNP